MEKAEAPMVPAPSDATERAASLSEALGALHAHAVEAQRTYNGRELTLFESDPQRIGRFIDVLLEGNYRETSANIAGITYRAVQKWMKAAEEGDPRYEVIARAIKIAESLAEASAVRSVRAAGKDPRFWAAEMTYLERKHPDRWARRQDANDGPQVVVQIGVAPGDVQVALVRR